MHENTELKNNDDKVKNIEKNETKQINIICLVKIELMK